ncbi:MAG: M3 family metallopeptidase, partial [Deltaproteobacteria bacterium]|nr:M3 family metallopeptidase [Deltaproteobacteria bacterium]
MRIFSYTLVGLALMLTPMNASADEPTPEPADAAVPAAADNPLLQPWSGPYDGLPPFGKVEVEHFAPALEAAMAELLAEVDAIATQKPKPTFENTIAALEDAGRTYNRVETVYSVYRGSMSTPPLREVELAMAPKIAAIGDEITQNEDLFARIEAVYTSKKFAKLNPEQQRLTWRLYTDFVRQGAKLDAEKKERLAAINQDLAVLFAEFRQNLLADEETWIVLESEEDLAGLPDSLVAAAAAAAEERDLEGKWVVLNTRSSCAPFLTYSSRRDLREKVWRAFVDRGDNGDDTDNNALIGTILALRAERAKLLGYETHAHWRLEDSMAGTPEATMALMKAVWKPAVARVREEVADQQALADAEAAEAAAESEAAAEGEAAPEEAAEEVAAADVGITIEPWDYRYYQEKVRKDRYDVDQDAIKPYMQLEKLRESMFWVAGELYGLRFEQISDVPVTHPDVRVWSVTDADGGLVGLWYFDPYARPGKRSGAWMNAYRQQERFRGEVVPIVSNNSNFVKGAPGKPVTISWDDAETLFHEFGHALHGLLSDVTYPSLSGTSVARDYVEFPSQINERWLLTPEVLTRFALHAETGEPIPDELVAKIREASTFNQGFETVEYLASALVDMKVHLAGDTPIDPDTFERETLVEIGMPKEIVMRHRMPQFAHLFSSASYSAA